MFVTNSSDEVITQKGELAVDLKAWKRFDTSDPWLQVTVSRGVEPVEEQSIIFLSDPMELQHLINSLHLSTDICVMDVAVSTPVDINGTGHWMLNRLLELVISLDLDTETYVQYRSNAGMHGGLPSSSIRGFVKKLYS